MMFCIRPNHRRAVKKINRAVDRGDMKRAYRIAFRYCRRAALVVGRRIDHRPTSSLALATEELEIEAWAQVLASVGANLEPSEVSWEWWLLHEQATKRREDR